jgi:FtsP/CotA-like multicopper oxidase with cupredoxin domain
MLTTVAVLLLASYGYSQDIHTLAEPVEMARTAGPVRGQDVNVSLEVKYAENAIFNPSSAKLDRVNLRSYNGALVGPTIRVRPGDTLYLKLSNNLPTDDPSCAGHGETPNLPNCFNSTNLHTHGLHVSPAGNSDNVLLSLPPGTSFDYIFNIPKNHPSGTFWYHSHRHGSTALQVSSGMAGALVVEGDRPAKDKAINGIADIDTILKYPDGKSFDEHVLLFEQIAYACGTTADGKVNWDCAGKTGVIEQYGDQFGPGTWPGSGRYTLINGEVQPTWAATTGRIQRWRIVHGGVRDTVLMKIVKAKPQPLGLLSFSAKAMSFAEQSNWVAQNCLLDKPVSVWEFAVDGLTRTKFSEKTINVFQPGYRSDVLALFREPGVYCVLDEQAQASQTINQQAKDRRLLGLIQASGPSVQGTTRDYLRSQLLAANGDLPASVKAEIENLELTTYAPYKDISAGAVTGQQSLAFFIDTTSDPLKFEINGQSYDPARLDKTLTLGSVDEWTITSQFVNHPFHIHVNPFQIEQILNPQGQSIIDANGQCIDKDSQGKPDTQYCDQIGVFRDTILTKMNYKIIARSRYETYTGEFVLHCHILDHEDQGMMQNVVIAAPGVELMGRHR